MIETAVNNDEAMAVLIFLIGYIPICMAYVQKRETRWLFFGYSLLLGGELLSIIEVFFMQTFVNSLEHFFGVMLSGIIFFICAYVSYKRLKKIQSKVYASIRTGRRKTYRTEKKVRVW